MHTFCMGQAASMGSLLLSAGERSMHSFYDEDVTQLLIAHIAIPQGQKVIGTVYRTRA